VFNIDQESNIILNVYLAQRRNALTHGGTEDMEEHEDIWNNNITINPYRPEDSKL